ncbi:LysR family transcriptional regulator [Acetobacteraceae bacterium H6797]|nr:LysR family transcriptional regulator [Acetobacteraceae bacterium H6797]
MPALTPSTDQVLTFLAVLRHGSFSAAAKALGRTQSSVTYAVQKLETDLGIEVFDRTVRAPKLTPQGKALLPAIRRMARELETIQSTADGLTRGLEGKLLLGVDAIYPSARLLPVLRDFAECFPTVRVRVGVESMHAMAEALMAGQYMLGIIGPMVERYPELTYLPIGGVERLAVVAAGHPLARWEGLVPAEAFRDHLHLVLASRSKTPRRKVFSLPSAGIWRVNDMAMKREMLLAGLGWGRLPRHLAEPEIAAGRLVQIRVEGVPGVDWSLPLPVYIAYRKNEVLGPGATWMRDAILEAATEPGRVAEPA